MIATYIAYSVLILVYITVVAMAIWAMRQTEPSEPSPGNKDMELGRMPSFVNPDLVAELLRNPPESLPDF
jgi:hypothetical protein